MTLKEQAQQLVYRTFDPLVRLIHAVGLRPNHITFLGLVITIWAVLHLLNYLDFEGFYFGDNLIGLSMILMVGGLMDMLDGRLARLCDLKSTFGAYFDSVIDRYSEFILFIGLAIYFVYFDRFAAGIFVLLAMMGSIMVSYNRSRAETLGVNCAVGIMQRPERIVSIAAWSLLWGIVFDYAPERFMDTYFLHSTLYGLGYGVLALATNITAIRRILFTMDNMDKSA